MATEHTAVHLPLEELDGAVEHRPQHGSEVDAEVGTAVQRLPAHQAHVVRVVGEEPEAGLDDHLHLLPTDLGCRDHHVEALEPVAQQLLEHLAVQRVLGREVVQQARPADADTCGDVVQRRAVVPGLGKAVERLGKNEVARRDVLRGGVGHTISSLWDVAAMRSVEAAGVLTPDGWTGPARLHAEGGVIVSVEPVATVTTEQLLVPGFIDLQVNGIDDVDVSRADGADWDRLDQLLLAQGVTTWCPTLVTMPIDRYDRPLARIAAAMARPPSARPTIAGAHLEGPFLGRAPGAHPRDLIVPIDLGWLAALPAHVAVVTLAAEQEDAVSATALLAAAGRLVSVGHT
ncbi:MAG: hypothetical protein RJA49_1285, partial [Actinomycetota bacterium]